MPEEVVEEIDQVEEPKVYDEKYVQKLREENAAKRNEAKEAAEKAQKAAERVRNYAVKDSVGDVLADPTDLLLHEPNAAIYDEDGEVDPVKAKEVAVNLVARKPYLGARKFGGYIGQGETGVTKEPVRSFHDILHSAL